MDLLVRRLPPLLVLTGVLAMTSCSPESTDTKGRGKPGIHQLQQKLVEVRRLEKKLEQEYTVARNSAPYLVVDLAKHTIELKAKGRVLRAFNIKRLNAAAIDADETIWVLSEARPIQKTERPKIKPGEGETATAEATKNNLWGLHRMPQDYDLVCNDGKILEFRALPSEQSGFTKSIKSAYRRTLDWYRRWRSSDRSQLQVIQLWMDENDSRLLFWSLPKQLKILVFADAYASGPLSDLGSIFQAIPLAGSA